MGKTKSVSSLRKRAKKITFDDEDGAAEETEQFDTTNDQNIEVEAIQEEQTTKDEDDNVQEEGQTKRKRVRKRKKTEDNKPETTAAIEADASK